MDFYISIAFLYTSIVTFMGLKLMIFHYVISHNSPQIPGKPTVNYLKTVRMKPPASGPVRTETDHRLKGVAQGPLMEW